MNDDKPQNVGVATDSAQPACSQCQCRRVIELETVMREEIDHLRAMCVGLQSASMMEKVLLANRGKSGKWMTSCFR